MGDMVKLKIINLTVFPHAAFANWNWAIAIASASML
jgi:hypothetical protein